MKITSLLEKATSYNRDAYYAEKQKNRAALADAVTPLQTGLLKRITAKTLDPLMHTLNARTHEALDGLVDLGLLDATYGLTPEGESYVRNADRTISADRQDAASKSKARKAMRGKEQVPVDVDVEDDLGDEDADEDDADDSDLDGTIRVAKPKTKVNPLHSDDFKSFDKDDMKGIDDEGEYKWD